MTWNQANIFKANWRLGLKDGTSKVYDLRKIIWFAQRELALTLKENENATTDLTIYEQQQASDKLREGTAVPHHLRRNFDGPRSC